MEVAGHTVNGRLLKGSKHGSKLDLSFRDPTRGSSLSYNHIKSSTKILSLCIRYPSHEGLGVGWVKKMRKSIGWVRGMEAVGRLLRFVSFLHLGILHEVGEFGWKHDW